MATICVVLKSLGDIVALWSLKNILNGASFSVDFVAELVGCVAFDGITLSINNVSKEREAAGGFFTPTGQWSFSVDTEAEEGEKISDFSYVAGPDGEVPPAFATDEETGLTLPNYRPLDLPSSGGAGTAALVCGGAAAVAAGAVWIARRRR